VLSFLKKHGALWLGLTGGALSVGLMIRAAILSTSLDATLFWVGAYVTGAIASFVLWRKEHQTAKTAAAIVRAELQKEIADARAENASLMAQLSKRARREDLARFLLEGRALSAGAGMEAWCDRVEKMLAKYPDGSYVARFRLHRSRAPVWVLEELLKELED
jgi:hypothetical protein